MFDGLRKDASDSSGFDEKQVDFFPEEKKPTWAPARKRKSAQFLGMTPQQRFLIAVMVMIMVCALGTACMVVSGSFVF
jgi:hypothetical protein